MAITKNSVPAPRRHWPVTLLLIGVGLLIYALTLAWASQRLENDIQKSIRPLPTLDSAQR